MAYHYQDGIFQRRGNLILSGVEIEHGGQPDTTNAAVDLQRIGEGVPSIVRKSSIHSALGWCVGADKSNNLIFRDNIVFDCEKYNIRIFNSNNYEVTGNLLLGNKIIIFFLNIHKNTIKKKLLKFSKTQEADSYYLTKCSMTK